LLLILSSSAAKKREHFPLLMFFFASKLFIKIESDVHQESLALHVHVASGSHACYKNVVAMKYKNNHFIDKDQNTSL
jgi:hypothetical protein